MFLFSFIRYLSFRKSGKTAEWQDKYDRLCTDTDYLYLRQLEVKNVGKMMFFFILYGVAMWWFILQPPFFSVQMVVVACLFTLIVGIYALDVYTYIPMEIENTWIVHRAEQIRHPSSIAGKKKLRDMEVVHHYFVYTTEDEKKSIDMTDRILGYDQCYEIGEEVFRFTKTKDMSYVLPVIRPVTPDTNTFS